MFGFTRKKVSKNYEYKVLSFEGVRNLEKAVCEHLNDGWVCVGGISNMAYKIGGNEYDFKCNAILSQAIQRVM